MNNVAAVGVGNGVGDRDDVVEQAESLLNSCTLGNEVSKRTSGYQLHCVEWRAIWPTTRFVNRNDPGVLETCSDQRLAQEAHLAHVRVGDKLLDRDVPAEMEVTRA